MHSASHLQLHRARLCQVHASENVLVLRKIVSDIVKELLTLDVLVVIDRPFAFTDIPEFLHKLSSVSWMDAVISGTGSNENRRVVGIFVNVCCRDKPSTRV